MKIQVLGTGCPKCRKLEENVKSATQNFDRKPVIEKVTDIKDIVSYGVMMTPALAVDGKVVLMGKVPSAGELEKILVELAGTPGS